MDKRPGEVRTQSRGLEPFNVRPLHARSEDDGSVLREKQQGIAGKHAGDDIHQQGRSSAGGGMGFSEPWSVDWCFSVIGSEYTHMYFWILKDLSWTQGWRLFSISFGSFAIMWWVIILYHSLRTRNTAEVWNAIGLFLWLFANFWWMTGEAHDYQYPDSPAISDRHLQESAIILETAVVWLSLYYFILLPLDLLPQTTQAMEEYDDGDFTPRFSYFRNFRQYENIHTLFWLCKDLAWNLDNISMWFVFLFPTVLVAVDLLWVSLCGKVRVESLPRPPSCARTRRSSPSNSRPPPQPPLNRRPSSTLRTLPPGCCGCWATRCGPSGSSSQTLTSPSSCGNSPPGRHSQQRGGIRRGS